MSVFRLILDGGANGPAVFSRSNAARGPDGAQYGPDEIRWDTERVVFGAPSIEVVDTDQSVYMAKAAGVGASGVPIVVVRKLATQEIVVRNASTLAVISATPTRGQTPYTKPSAADDMLRNQSEEEEDHCYEPRGHAFVHDGLIVIQCNVRSYSGVGDRSDISNWPERRMGAVYSLDNGVTWRILYRGPIEGIAGQRTNEWSGLAVPVSRLGFTPGGSVPELIVAHADYRIQHDGASLYLTRFTKSGGSWVAGMTHRQEYGDPGNSNTHLHIPILFKDPSNQNGCKLIWSVGDGRANNVTLETLIADFDWSDASPVSDSVNVREGSSKFTAPSLIGGAGTGSTSTSLHADQTISVAPAFGVNEYAIGNDEGMSAVLRAVAPSSDGDPFELRASYTQSVLSQHSGNQRVFQLAPQSWDAINPTVVGLWTPGSRFVSSSNGGFDDAGDYFPRVICKPEGETAWGVVFALTGEGGSVDQRRPVIDPLGYVWLSTGVVWNGLRRFKLPPYRVVRGGYAGPGGTNHALQDPGQLASPDASNSMTEGYVLPGQSPSSDAVVIRAKGAGTSINNGQFIVTNPTVPRSHTNLWFVQNVGPVLYDGSDSTVKSSHMHRQRLFSAVDGIGGQKTPFRGATRIEAQGSYTTLWQRHVSGGVDWDTSQISTDPFRLAVQPQFGDGTKHDGDAALQWAMVLIDPETPPSYMLPTTEFGSPVVGDDETLYMPVTCGSEWSALASLALFSRDSWWHDTISYRPVLTFWQDTNNYVSVEHNGQSNVRIRWRVNGVDEGTRELTLDARILRGDPLHVGVSCSSGLYEARLSVAGSPVLSVLNYSGTAVVPTRVYIGGDGSEYEATIGFAVRVDGSSASTGSDLESSLRSLGSFGPAAVFWTPIPAFMPPLNRRRWRL